MWCGHGGLPIFSFLSDYHNTFLIALIEPCSLKWPLHTSHNLLFCVVVGVSPFAALQLTCYTRGVGVKSADKNRYITLHKGNKMEMRSSGWRVGGERKKGRGLNGGDTGDNGGDTMWILISCINSCNAHGYFNNGPLLLCSHADSQPILNYSNTLGNI